MARTLTSMPDAVQEQALIRLAQDGDPRAFDQLVRTHFQPVYALLYRLLGNHEDAEDLAQECFVRAHRSLGFYRGEAAFSTWLHRIAVHLAADHRRAQGRRLSRQPLEPLTGEHPVPAARTGGPEEQSSRRELTLQVAIALQRLPVRLRVALVLRVLEGREYEELARITGVQPATARTQVMQARRLLLGWLAPWLAPGSERGPR
jgi:RNA polymerase sigma-70 factor, ECF subfamily